MGFEDIPEDFEISNPCPECDDGNVTLIDGKWQCDNCNYSYIPQIDKEWG